VEDRLIEQTRLGQARDDGGAGVPSPPDPGPCIQDQTAFEILDARTVAFVAVFGEDWTNAAFEKPGLVLGRGAGEFGFRGFGDRTMPGPDFKARQIGCAVPWRFGLDLDLALIGGGCPGAELAPGAGLATVESFDDPLLVEEEVESLARGVFPDVEEDLIGPGGQLGDFDLDVAAVTAAPDHLSSVAFCAGLKGDGLVFERGAGGLEVRG